MKKLSQACKWLFLGAVLCASPSYAATLVVSGGLLTGATGVNVNGSWYDVSFQDGSCDSLFSNCTISAFMFQNSTDAFAASNALLDQVLVGAYDDLSSDIFGCYVDGIYCSVMTPYNRSTQDAYVANAYNLASGTDLVFTGTMPPGSASTGFMNNTVFAVWTVAEVPVPAAAWLFGSALVGLAGAAGRKRKTAVA